MQVPIFNFILPTNSDQSFKFKKIQRKPPPKKNAPHDKKKKFTRHEGWEVAPKRIKLVDIMYRPCDKDFCLPFFIDERLNFYKKENTTLFWVIMVVLKSSLKGNNFF